jgi:hypothetical protein
MTVNKSFKNAEKFKYIEMTVANQNLIHEKITSRLNSHTMQFRIFCLPICYLEIYKIKINESIILSVVLCGREMWYLTLKEEHRFRVCENMVLRRI